MKQKSPPAQMTAPQNQKMRLRTRKEKLVEKEFDARLPPATTDSVILSLDVTTQRDISVTTWMRQTPGKVEAGNRTNEATANLQAICQKIIQAICQKIIANYPDGGSFSAISQELTTDFT